MPFQPTVFRNREGKCIEVFWSNEMYFAKYINPSLTLYIGENSRVVVGVQIDDEAESRAVSAATPTPR